jgi:hypothetical protein
VCDQPGDELDSVKLRSVSGFNASAKATPAGNIAVATRATAALSIVPRRAIDLNVYVLISLLYSFLFSFPV